jgi:beta-glucanase (GH16 family)
MRTIIAIALVFLSSFCFAQSPPSQAAGYSLVWSDNFAALSLNSGNAPGYNWYDTGFFFGTPIGTITDPSNTYVNIQWASAQVYATNMATNSPNGLLGHAWTFGYFEISMAFNPTTGSWPALWMMAPSVNSGGLGSYSGPELDIFEWQNQIPTLFNGTLHTWVSGTPSVGYEQVTPANPSVTWSSYNTFGVLWTPTQVCWYLNNVSQGCASTTAAPYSTYFGGSTPMFLLLSQQAGCNWVQSYTTACPGQVSPLNMQVQFVHVFQLTGSMIAQAIMK